MNHRLSNAGAMALRSTLAMSTLVAAGLAGTSSIVTAQTTNDPLLYAQQALQFSMAATGVIAPASTHPGTSFADGYASLLDNPASVALFTEGFADIRFGYDRQREKTSYLGIRPSIDEDHYSIGTLGLVYAFPTSQGTFNVGAGYQQLGTYHRVMSIGGRNGSHSITDQFKIPNSYYNGIAFDSYAIDFGDVDQTYLESIFRIGFPPGEFLGIDQQAEVIETGTGGEFNAVAGIEIKKDLFIGASIGFFNSSKRYQRTFLEVDAGNLYDGDFIDTDNDGDGDSDIDRMLLTDDIRSEASAASLRIGAVYKVSDNIRIGASYKLPSRMTVNETYDATIRSTMDDASYFQTSNSGDFKYAVDQPGTMSLGFSFGSIQGFSASFGFDRTDYAAMELSYWGEDSFLDERRDNEYIRERYRQVVNARGGIGFTFDGGARIAWGYSNRPSPFEEGGTDLRMVTLSAEIPLQGASALIASVQRADYDDTTVLYNYEDAFFQPATQTVNRDVQSMAVRIGFKIGF